MHSLRQPKGFYTSAIVLMLPLVLQNLITNSMALADTFMVGVLGETELAAVTLANSPFFILSLMTFGIQSGTSVLAAQYYGRGDKQTLSRILGIGLYISVLLTTVLGVAALCVPEAIMGVLTNNETLIAPGAAYCRCVGFAYVFDAASQIYIGIQRSTENTKLGMYVLTGSGLLNVFLNWCLIFGNCGMPALGVSGAALGTLLARIAQLIAVVIYACISKRIPLVPKLILRPGKVIAKDFLRYSLPVVINETLWSTAQSAYTVIMGHMAGSAQILAAYTLAGNMDRLMSAGLFAMGGAAAIIIGRDIGKGGDRDSIYRESIGLNVLAVSIGVVSMALVLIVRTLCARQLIFPLMSISGESADICMYLLMVAALIEPLRALTMTDIVGCFRAGGDVTFAAMMDVMPLWLFALPLTGVLALVFGCGIRIVYLTMYTDELIKVIIILFRLPSKKWINNVTRSAEDIT